MSKNLTSLGLKFEHAELGIEHEIYPIAKTWHNPLFQLTNEEVLSEIKKVSETKAIAKSVRKNKIPSEVRK